MGVCWHSTSDTSKTKTNRLTNQVITASFPQPKTEQQNQNIPKEETRNDNQINKEPNNPNSIFNNSFEESLKLFPDMEEWGNGVTKGYGIKQMPAYKCDLKIDELNKKREEFWNSKTKLKTKWKIIHQACIYDHINAEEFLYKNNMKTLEGCINICKDNQGNIFRVPNYCINDPYFELELLDKDKDKGENIEIKLLDIVNQKNNKINVADNITGEELIKKYAEDENIDLTKNKIKLLFGGGIIKEDETLFQHKVQNGFTIQICIVPL
jgi:hypothetical protein